MQKVELIIIDPQNDFMDLPDSALGVPGAVDDSKRLSQVIAKNQRAISSINITLDTHQLLDIAHPLMWVDSKGRNPDPFTIISKEDVEQGKWRAFNPAYQKRLLNYVIELEKNGKYALCIWPPHTLVGNWGHNIVDSIYGAVTDWEIARMTRFNAVTKGHNPWSEQYSAVKADVSDPSDPTTQLNTGLIQTLENADLVLITGQALSHCVAETVRDIADNFGDESIRKMVLIEDTTSPVPGFESLATDFLAEMKNRGMQTVKAAEVII